MIAEVFHSWIKCKESNHRVIQSSTLTSSIHLGGFPPLRCGIPTIPLSRGNGCGLPGNNRSRGGIPHTSTGSGSGSLTALGMPRSLIPLACRGCGLEGQSPQLMQYVWDHPNLYQHPICTGVNLPAPYWHGCQSTSTPICNVVNLPAPPYAMVSIYQHPTKMVPIYQHPYLQWFSTKWHDSYANPNPPPMCADRTCNVLPKQP